MGYEELTLRVTSPDGLMDLFPLGFYPISPRRNSILVYLAVADQ